MIEIILGIDDKKGIDRIKANSLSINMRLLHHIILGSLYPVLAVFTW